MTQSTKQKGRLLENYVADQIVAKGLDPKARANGDSGAGNRDKSDISTSMMVLGQNAGIECKNQSVLKIQDWWRQTKKLESLRMTPILAFHIENEAWEETKVVIYLDTFLDLVKNQGDAPIVTGESQNRVYSKRGKPKICAMCEKTDQKRYDWANMTGKLSDIYDYVRLCRSCHFKFDGMIKNIIKNV